jgi:hypothetical protein
MVDGRMSRQKHASRNLVALGAVGLALAAMLVYAVGATGQGSSGSPPSAAVSPAMGEAYPALTRDGDAEDALPARAGRGLRRFSDVDPDGSREVLAADGVKIYLVPGAKHLCTVESSEYGDGVGCTDLDTALDPARPQITVMAVPDGTRLTGVFPADVKDAALVTKKGNAPLELSDGAFSVLVPQGDGTLSWTTNGGRSHELPAGMPAPNNSASR